MVCAGQLGLARPAVSVVDKEEQVGRDGRGARRSKLAGM